MTADVSPFSRLVSRPRSSRLPEALARDRRPPGGRLARGLVAGAVGTVALNAVTYLDMVLRARPASGTPEESVRRLAGLAGIRLGDGEQAENRTQGFGPLLGVATGLGAAVAWSLVADRRFPALGQAVGLTALAMTAANAPMAATGVSDPRTWSASDWLADAVPHLAYGAAAAAALRRLR